MAVEDLIGAGKNVKTVGYQVPATGINNIVLQLGGRTGNTLKAINEYFKNEYEARDQAEESDQARVELELIKKKRQLVGIRISGYGSAGMDLDTILRIPTMLGDSIKNKELNKADENFGTGATVWTGIGNKATWISKSKKDGKTYFYSVGADDLLHGRAGETDLPRSEYGTDVFIEEITSQEVRKQLTVDKLLKFLSDEHTPWILEEDASLKIIDEGKEYLVEPIKPTGNLIIEERVKIDNIKYSIFIYLHPKRSDAKIKLRTKAESLEDNINKLDRFSKSPWTSGYISGVIMAEGIPQQKDRSGPDYTRPETDAFLTSLDEKFTQKLTEIVDNYKQSIDEEAKVGMYKIVKSAARQIWGGNLLEDRGFVADPSGELTGSYDEPKKQKEPGDGSGSGSHSSGKRRRRARLNENGRIRVKEIVKKGGFNIIEEDLGDSEKISEWRPNNYQIVVNEGHPLYIQAQQSGSAKLIIHVARAVCNEMTLLQYADTTDRRNLLKEFIRAYDLMEEKINIK